ncbi:MAG: hypothetical protein IJQ11_09330 [Bacteroidales bacterium]|nr:hypothetical protein [Bacteroidales bacterium]
MYYIFEVQGIAAVFDGFEVERHRHGVASARGPDGDTSYNLDYPNAGQSIIVGAKKAETMTSKPKLF